MKSLVRTQQPLTAKTKGDEVSEEGTSTLKGSSRLMQLAQQEIRLNPQTVAKFHNAIGAIIRTKVVVDPTIEKWTLVPEGEKETMWQLLSRSFVFPRGTRDKVKHYARKMLGETSRRWKSELNVRYVKKGLTPFADYGDITPAQWEEFVR